MGLIALMYTVSFILIIKYGKSIKSKLLSLIAISFIATILLYALDDFTQTTPEMQFVRSLFGIAPRTSHTIEIDIENAKLNFIIELDFNTGARGGAFIKNSFFYLTDTKKKEVLITQHGIHIYDNFYKEALDIKKIANETESHQNYGKYYIDLYFSPKLFSLEEFEKICDFLKQNHNTISKKINDYKENQKSQIFNKTRFRNAYYQDINSLKKIYNCTNNLQLHLRETGRLYFITKDNISTTYNDIGNIKDHGNKLLLDEHVELSKKSGRHQISRGNTLIQECFDNNGTNLFEEFQIEKI